MTDHNGCPECGSGYVKWMGIVTQQGDDDLYADQWWCGDCGHGWTETNPDLESPDDDDDDDLMNTDIGAPFPTRKYGDDF